MERSWRGKPMRRLFALAVLLVSLLLGPTGESLAAPITVPTDLKPGDEYRLAFVTSTGRDATSKNIADYNDFVTAAAESVPELLALSTTWRAIASVILDAGIHARVNTNTDPATDAGVPIYLLNDTVLATDNEDLWDGSIGVPLNIDEHANVSVSDVWTGTASEGSRACGMLACFTLGLDFVVFNFLVGSVESTDPFNFVGAYINAGFRDDLQLIVDGYLGSSLLYTRTIDINTLGPSWYSFEYSGVDRSVFTPSPPNKMR